MNKLSIKARKIMFLYNVCFIAVAAIFGNLLPVLLNYPPNSINNNFETHIDDGYLYNQQYYAIVIVALIISNFLLVREIRKVTLRRKEDSSEITEGYLNRVAKACFSSPIKLYLIHTFAPPVAIVLVMMLTGAKVDLTIRIASCMLIIFMMFGLLIFILSKSIFEDILTSISNRKTIEIKRNFSKYRERIYLQFMPLAMVVGLMIYLAANSINVTEKSKIIYNEYNEKFEENDYSYISSQMDALQYLNKNIAKKSSSDTYFIMSKDKVVYTDNNREISDFFRIYAFMQGGSDNHAYEYYTSETQGVFRIFKENGVTYAYGIIYDLDQNNNYLLIIVTMIVLMIVVFVFLTVIARDITKPIENVTEYMKRLATGKDIDYNQKLPVTSNDEVGDLTVAFNKILDVEKKYVDTIKQNQDALIESERLSSLGQMIGGIAHNLKTPIMSISGYLEAMERLTKEFYDSVGNPQVTKEDYADIVKDMNEAINKSREYLSYMTEVINATKGQAVSLNASTVTSFTIKELVTRTSILMSDTLKKANVVLKTNVTVDENVELRGELAALVQIMDNLVMNAIQAYNGKTGNIDISIHDDNSKVYIDVADKAGGIPESIVDKLFNEMVTTKGKAGTGLGLYMCYSTIKGRFKGDMSFDTEHGVGTTFHIVLNKA